MKQHANVAIFVPHGGCPHQCSFCNQHTISGTQFPPTPKEAAEVAAKGLESLGEKAQDAEIAFFGGSFTAVDRAYRTALLEAVQPYLGPKGFGGIRISTRPDCIDPVVLEELKRYGVRVIELGVQSMRDKVLIANRRGHTPKDVENASRLIKDAGIMLGHQMMTGLYEDDDQGALETAERIAELQPDMVRIYPTLVFPHTQLCQLYGEGAYTPQSLKDAVVLSAKLLAFFHRHGIPVIRLGLHQEQGLLDNLVAGPHHPAFRELCESHLLLSLVEDQLKKQRLPQGKILLYVHPRWVSKMIGQRRANLASISQWGYTARVCTDDALQPMEVRICPGEW